ncbi:DUF1014-domain-containing protein [Neocallimastix californiae]|uniref:DUF1014-domain-containing protein n=1 Tax=Neocallimastix californiae TaxID=1754190 RepID=A0A1Y2CU93_9FUNG|nr:DUF1014-domain-containing protein [Neocallimastix californiae]|eukprot:ORY50609.1 DUF1014-domain-containing protein [Neocallimastix californiae]
MAKKFKSVNIKVAAANERKAKVKAEKDRIAAEQKEKEEALEWSKGAKDQSKKLLAEKKRRQEEEELAKSKVRGNIKEDARKFQRKANYYSSNSNDSLPSFGKEKAEEFGASGIDNALDLMSAINEPDEAASGNNNNNNKIDRHPERRVKSAYAVFEEKTMPILKAENPHLRRTQLKQMLQKKWKKSPDNPMNQQYIAYNATQDEENQAVSDINNQVLNRLRIED